MGHFANYTIRAIVCSGLGCLLFIPILLAPGYVTAWLTGVLDFRALTVPWRVLVSLPLSVAICPIVTYWAGLAGHWAPVFALYGACSLLWIYLLLGFHGHEAFPQWLREFRRVPRIGWVIPAVWLVVAIASLVSLQLNNGLYLSVTDYDHVTRAAITGAITRRGVRPFNPFYLLGAPAPLRYHYFWFLLCSIDEQLGKGLLSSQQAIIASAVWCGWSLIALVPLYLRFFQQRTGINLRRCSLIAIGLFAVTGLDLIPTALRAASGRATLPEMEWWNEQVTSWFGSVLWVPHHVAALVACLAGFLIAWDASRIDASVRRRITGAMLAGAAFATASGTSIYVTLVFVVFIAAWIPMTWFRHWRAATAVLMAAGVIAILLALPYLLSLTGGGSGGSFVKFDVRHFTPLESFTAAMPPGSASVALLRLLVLPLNYFLELGFFGVASVVLLLSLRRESPLRPNVAAALTMAAASVTVCTFVRSGVLYGNDLGWRGFLPAQFIMLLWGADLMVRRGQRAEATGKGFHSWWLRSPVWAPLIVIGFLGTIYELVLLRTYLLWSDAGLIAPGYLTPDRQFGERALELRRAYETLDHILPSSAKLQSNPQGLYFDFYEGLYSNRQTIIDNRYCGTEFGGDPANCPAAYSTIAAIFNGNPDVTPEMVGTICRQLSIDAVIVTDLDRAWNFGSWAWRITPAIPDEHVRVYLMGGPLE